MDEDNQKNSEKVFNDSEVTEEQYQKIIRDKNNGKILIYIDTASFRKFFTEVDTNKIQKLIGHPLKHESLIIKVILYALEPLSLLASIVSSVFLFKWFSILVIPIIFISWAFLKSHSANGKQSILFPIILIIAIIIIAITISEIGIWYKLFTVCIIASYFFTRLLYYLTAFFTFRLIDKNYYFFKLFYERPNSSILPMIWTKSLNCKIKKS